MNTQKLLLNSNPVSLHTQTFKTSDEATAFSIVPNGSPRSFENSTKVTIGSEISRNNQETPFAVDIKNREVTTMVPYVGTSMDKQDLQEQSVQNSPGFFQRMKERNERMKLMSEKNRRENNAVLEKIKVECSQISESVKALEEKQQALEEAQLILHETTQSLQLEVLNRLEKINECAEEAKQKADMNLQLAQIQASNEYGRENTIQQLNITYNTFQQIADYNVLDFPNITNSIATLSMENNEIRKAVSLISKVDQI